MNALQTNYTNLKSKYDVAFKNEDWDTVDNVEDSLLDAEFALVDWSLEEVVKTGKMSKEDATLLRKRSSGKQWDKMIDLALRLEM